MSDHFPIVDQIDEVNTHAERVAILLACPRLHLARSELALRHRLNVAGFPEAADYVSIERIALEAVRGPDGADRLEIQIMRAQTILDMRAKAVQEGAT
ncbi:MULTISPECIES: hypothetical protein [unclassified Shinella]|uniref:hypothetical protein n=1 Tax=unclassified Shinella TaxID=2643062 RepID=UPI00234F0AB6|nr:MULTISPECIES: hypothetical protein [unclassified Shinella]MCO5153363.1 hypothetical protein [Shinella sp.]MDC7260542.1 hypothetical protein [Shinella sp. HY16]MDC7267437.1 hypothetical protein [Shinella sp. YZ44]